MNESIMRCYRVKIACITLWIAHLSQHLCVSLEMITTFQVTCNTKKETTRNNSKQNHACTSFGKKVFHHFVKESDTSEEVAFDRTRRLMKDGSNVSSYYENGNFSSAEDEKATEKETMYQHYVKKPANSLKEELKRLGLESKGRKPDLARRLVDYHFVANANNVDDVVTDASDSFESTSDNELEVPLQWKKSSSQDAQHKPLRTFASLNLSETAGNALSSAGFLKPSNIQSVALPLLTQKRKSAILHAETGSGKTLCYLLPITESLWKQKGKIDQPSTSYALILTPTR